VLRQLEPKPYSILCGYQPDRIATGENPTLLTQPPEPQKGPGPLATQPHEHLARLIAGRLMNSIYFRRLRCVGAVRLRP